MTKIIAEFCQNHNGDFDILKRMIEEAALSGATYGKMQTIFSKNLNFRPQFEEGLIINEEIYSIKRPFDDEFNRLKKLEISQTQMVEFVRLCKQNGLIPLTTCFARTDAKIIKEVGFDEIKVASYDCASYPMIRELKSLFSNLIISTGASFDNEIQLTAEILKNHNYSFLHCVTIYPTPLNEMNLARMEYLKKFTNKVGFSDHSLVSKDDIVASKAAIFLGAKIIERHFSILKPNETRDGPVSINSNQLKELSIFSKMSQKEQLDNLNRTYPDWKQMIGKSKRSLTKEELLNRDYYRGRFGSPRQSLPNKFSNMILNWEETPLNE